MERRLNVVAAPTKAPLDLSGGVGQELTLGKQALLPGGSLYSRSLWATQSLASLDKSVSQSATLLWRVLDSEQVLVGRGVSLSLLQGRLPRVLHV